MLPRVLHVSIWNVVYVGMRSWPAAKVSQCSIFPRPLQLHGRRCQDVVGSSSSSSIGAAERPEPAVPLHRRHAHLHKIVCPNLDGIKDQDADTPPSIMLLLLLRWLPSLVQNNLRQQSGSDGATRTQRTERRGMVVHVRWMHVDGRRFSIMLHQRDENGIQSLPCVQPMLQLLLLLVITFLTFLSLAGGERYLEHWNAVPAAKTGQVDRGVRERSCFLCNQLGRLRTFLACSPHQAEVRVAAPGALPCIRPSATHTCHHPHRPFGYVYVCAVCLFVCLRGNLYVCFFCTCCNRSIARANWLGRGLYLNQSSDVCSTKHACILAHAPIYITALMSIWDAFFTGQE